MNVEGKATFSCIVAATGKLTSCVIVSEEPLGYGFGEATLRMTKLFRVKPVLADGTSVVGTAFQHSVAWKLPH